MAATMLREPNWATCGARLGLNETILQAGDKLYRSRLGNQIEYVNLVSNSKSSSRESIGRQHDLAAIEGEVKNQLCYTGALGQE